VNFLPYIDILSYYQDFKAEGRGGFIIEGVLCPYIWGVCMSGRTHLDRWNESAYNHSSENVGKLLS
jgi:hypothetical protein